MPNRRNRNERVSMTRRWLPALIAVFLMSVPLLAQTEVGPVTVGAGLQTSFAHTKPTGGDTTDQLLLNSVRLYVNGAAANNIKFMFNTEYDGTTNKVGILDAVGRIEVSPKFNIWAGRFLPPSDRANLYGPYYAHHWNVFSDGVQDGYPFVATGRDNGVVYWGDFGKLKVSGGGFDGRTATGQTSHPGHAEEWKSRIAFLKRSTRVMVDPKARWTSQKRMRQSRSKCEARGKTPSGHASPASRPEERRPSIL